MVIERNLQIGMIYYPVEPPWSGSRATSNAHCPQHHNLLDTIIFHYSQAVADRICHEIGWRGGFSPWVIARAAIVQGRYDCFDGIGLGRIGEGFGDVACGKRGAGGDGYVVGVSCESFGLSHEGGNGVASLQSFREDGGASTAIGA